MIAPNGNTKTGRGGTATSTNQKMALTAAIEALKTVSVPRTIVLHTCSQYVVDGMSKWLEGWKAKGWKNADKQPVANRDLWEALDEAAARHTVSWCWVRSHAGNKWDTKADELANEGMRRHARESMKA